MVDNSLYDELIYDRTVDNINIIKALSKKRYIDFTAIEKQQWIDNIKKGCYYTNTYGLFCKVSDVEGDNIHVYELDTTDLPSLTKETYYWRSFKETYYRKCTKRRV